MSPESISIWTMFAAWAGAIATLSAVIVALYLPRYQLRKANENAEKNACKLISVQLLIVQDDITIHLNSLKANAFYDSPFKNISYLTTDIISAIDNSKLESLYRFMHHVDKTNGVWRNAFNLINDHQNPKFRMYQMAYSDGVNSLKTKVKELIVTFES
ncbi:MAG: hypothetical protein V5788_11790 [Shewanella sp.]